MSEMEKFAWGAKEIPVVRNVDVLVAGGGYAGFGAAICAARNGAKVLLVEQQSALGGLVTMGYVALTIYEKEERFFVNRSFLFRG